MNGRRATRRGDGEHRDQRREHRGDDAEHRLDLGAENKARRHRRGGDEIGRVFAGDGEPGETAGELARRHHQHRDEQVERAAAGLETPPQQHRRRHQIKHLHQRLRHEPRIAAQQQPFLAAKRASGRSGAEDRLPLRPPGRRILDAGRGNGIFAEARRDQRHRGGEQGDAESENADERHSFAKHGARRPPDDAADVGRVREQSIRLQHARLRQRPVGQDRRDLQSDDESGADHRGEHLGDQTRALRADGAEQSHRHRHRKRCRRGAHGDDHPVSTKPAPAAAHDQHVDERPGKRHRHHRDGERDRRDADGKQLMRRRRRRENEIEIGAGVERARHRFHRLRDHQQPRQQQRRGDRDHGVLVGRGIGGRADDEIGDRVHENDEGDKADDDAAHAGATAGGHHRQPVAPGEPRFVPREPDRGAGLHGC